jgi:hypothetical protein
VVVDSPRLVFDTDPAPETSAVVEGASVLLATLAQDVNMNWADRSHQEDYSPHNGYGRDSNLVRYLVSPDQESDGVKGDDEGLL